MDFLKKRSVVFLLAIALPKFFYAQNFTYLHYSYENGLPAKSIHSITQDQKGFLWLGTWSGLIRFDGYEFRSFISQDDDTSSLSNNKITSLLIDHAGSLWVGTQGGGLNLYDPKTESFIHFQHDSTQARSLASDEIFTIFQDSAGDLWLGTSAGLDKMDAKTQLFTHFPLPVTSFSNILVDYHVHRIMEYQGELWLGTWGAGVWCFNKKTGAMRRVFAEVERFNGKNWVDELWTDAESGMIWSLQSGAFYQFDVKRGVFRQVLDGGDSNSPDGNLTSGFKMPSGQFLFGTQNKGLQFFDSTLKPLGSAMLNPDLSVSGSNFIQTIFQDRSGEVWLGMLNAGLFKFDPLHKPFETFSRCENGRDVGMPRGLTAVCERKNGEIWVTSPAEGVQILDPKTQCFQLLRERASTPEAIKGSHFRRIFEDSHGRIFLGNWGKGLMVFDEKTGDFYDFPEPPDIGKLNKFQFVSAIGESSDGKIWAGTTDGLAVYDVDEAQPTLARKFEKAHYFENFGMPVKNFTQFLSDAAGRFWMVCEAGLVRLNLKTGERKVFTHVTGDPNSLPKGHFSTIFQDRKNRIWACSEERAMFLFDELTQHFVKFDVKNESIVGCKGIVEDAQGFFWVTTGRGLIKFDPERGTFSKYIKGDGLSCDRFSIGAIARSRFSGKIFAGAEDGFVIFQPDSIRNSTFVPPVVISNLKKYVLVGNQFQSEKVLGIAALDRIELPFSENTLSFEFAALSFRQAEKNQFAYRLRGVGENWVQLGTRREVTFSNLPPGKYVLEIKASNNDGLWNETGTSLAIYILPPWWMTWWAYLLYFLAAGGVLFAFFQLQLRRREDRAEVHRQKLLNEAKSQFLSTVSHELRTPLTSILGFSKIIKKRLEERIFPKTDFSDTKTERAATLVVENLGIVVSESERLTALINEVLDLAKIESGKIEWREESLEIKELVAHAVAATATLFDNKKLWLRQEISRDLPNTLGDPDRLLQVLVNLFSNAVKFTERGGATVSARLNDERTIIIGVTDTGIGIPKEYQQMVFEKFRQVSSDTLTDKPQGTGLGLPICKEIVEHHGGRIWVESEEGGGTTFWFTLPVRQENHPKFIQP